ncbi:MAG: hypothetical protein NT124_02145 [Candidatus Dependentiae bacterium]|nr:hypothetical protein [Candidatus Dependentiae bacterium]
MANKIVLLGIAHIVCLSSVGLLQAQNDQKDRKHNHSSSSSSSSDSSSSSNSSSSSSDSSSWSSSSSSSDSSRDEFIYNPGFVDCASECVGNLAQCTIACAELSNQCTDICGAQLLQANQLALQKLAVAINSCTGGSGYNACVEADEYVFEISQSAATQANTVCVQHCLTEVNHPCVTNCSTSEQNCLSLCNNEESNCVANAAVVLESCVAICGRDCTGAINPTQCQNSCITTECQPLFEESERICFNAR